MKKPITPAVVLAAGALLLLAACGDDKTTAPPDDSLLNIRDGIWGMSVVDSLSGSGPGCQVEPTRAAGPIPLCDLDALIEADSSCTVTLNGDVYTIDCEETGEEDGCDVVHHTTGTATFSSTSFTIELTLTITPAGPCGATFCTETIRASGTWLAGGDCPAAAGAGPEPRGPGMLAAALRPPGGGPPGNRAPRPGPWAPAGRPYR